MASGNYNSSFLSLFNLMKDFCSLFMITFTHARYASKNYYKCLLKQLGFKATIYALAIIMNDTISQRYLLSSSEHSLETVRRRGAIWGLLVLLLYKRLHQISNDVTSQMLLSKIYVLLIEINVLLIEGGLSESLK